MASRIEMHMELIRKGMMRIRSAESLHRDKATTLAIKIHERDGSWTGCLEDLTTSGLFQALSTFTPS